jgi:hypothetical protein
MGAVMMNLVARAQGSHAISYVSYGVMAGWRYGEMERGRRYVLTV